MPRSRSLPLPLLALGLVFLVAACGDEDPVDPDTVTAADFVGTWNWTVSDIQSTCGSEGVWTTPVVITQTGPTTVSATSQWGSTDPGTHETTGFVTGNVLSLAELTYTEDTGMTTTTFTVTLQNDGTLRGSESWTWTDSGGTCSNGTADVFAELD